MEYNAVLAWATIAAVCISWLLGCLLHFLKQIITQFIFIGCNGLVVLYLDSQVFFFIKRKMSTTITFGLGQPGNEGRWTIAPKHKHKKELHTRDRHWWQLTAQGS
jgi:hypothetical protein